MEPVTLVQCILCTCSDTTLWVGFYNVIVIERGWTKVETPPIPLSTKNPLFLPF